MWYFAAIITLYLLWKVRPKSPLENVEEELAEAITTLAESQGVSDAESFVHIRNESKKEV